MWAAMIPMLMQMMQSQGQQGGGQEGGQQGGGGQGGMPNFMSMFSGQGGQGGAGGGQGGGGMMSGLGSAMQTPGARMGGIANGLFNLFGAKNPSDAADPYLSGSTDEMNRLLSPYNDAGMRAMPTLEREYNRSINDPTSVMNGIGAGYQKSPGYDWQVGQAEGAANRGAAAGGMLGSPMQQQNIASTVNGLANQDYYKYVDRGIGQYNMGLGGLQGLNNNGLSAANTMGSAAMQKAMAQAQNAYAGANTSNQQKGGGIGSIIGGLF